MIHLLLCGARSGFRGGTTASYPDAAGALADIGLRSALFAHLRRLNLLLDLNEDLLQRLVLGSHLLVFLL